MTQFNTRISGCNIRGHKPASGMRTKKRERFACVTAVAAFFHTFLEKSGPVIAILGLEN